MAVKVMTYLDLSEEVRAHAGAQFAARVRERLADRTLSEGQREALLAEVSHIESWVAGTLPVATPTHHDVQVVETVGIVEGV